VGAVPRGRVLRRGGARPGDALLVSGTLGDAALGLGPRAAERSLVRRQRRPVPRVALGRALAGVASAAIDLSDGLVQDLGHVCAASGTGAVVHAGRLPLSPAYRRRAAALARPLDAALAGGEDYELLVAVPPARLRRALAAARAVRVPLTAIGEVTRAGGVRVLDARGRPYALRTRGHDHLRPPTPR
jgi:thiamine-monophosphate kinase